MINLGTTGGRVQQELTRAESLALLGSVPMGRVVFTHQALPAIRPVNHVLDGDQILIRTHPGAAILAAARQRVVVAYEADQIDPDERLGWSVVVTGVARPMPDDAAEADHLPRSWIQGPMHHLIAISTDLVSGFRLAAVPEQATPGG